MIRLTRPNKREVLINPDNIKSIYVDDDFDVCIDMIDSDDLIVVTEDMKYIEELILRDKFAAVALSGILANDYGKRVDSDFFALDAYLIADQMLKQRKGE